jgi:iron complex outermembrane receptor protein
VGPPLGPNIDKLSTRTFSHEARVNGSWDRADAVLGIYYFDSKAHPEFASIRTGRSDIADYVVTSQAKAVFGQLTYSVFDELRVTGGLRYTSQKRELDGETRIFPVGAAFDIYRGKRSEERLDWRLGAEYDLTPRSMLYANVATGFTAGGFANTSGGRANAAAFPFESVTLTAYTAGSKNSLANGALTLNFEGFYYDYKNYQVSQRNAITGLNLIFNADQAEVYGAQLDARLNFSSADQLSLGVAYVHAEAVRLRTSAGIFDGYTLPYSPKWTVNGSYSHTFDLANGGDVEALINTSYASDRWAFYSHPRGGLIPGNTTTNVSLIYNEPGQRWSLSGWVRNLEDNLTQGVGLVGVPRADSAYFLMPPRTFGATFSFNY